MSFTTYLKRGIKYIIYGQPMVNNNVIANVTYTSPTNILINKKIIVTGGGRGLGFAMAKKFKAEGAKVLITGRNNDVLEKASKELNCSYMKFDVQNSSSYKEFIYEADKILGGIRKRIHLAVGHIELRKGRRQSSHDRIEDDEDRQQQAGSQYTVAAGFELFAL